MRVSLQGEFALNERGKQERKNERERERVNLNGNLKAAAPGVVVGKVLSEDRQRF